MDNEAIDKINQLTKQGRQKDIATAKYLYEQKPGPKPIPKGDEKPGYKEWLNAMIAGETTDGYTQYRAKQVAKQRAQELEDLLGKDGEMIEDEFGME
jgi:hypothetical protein